MLPCHWRQVCSAPPAARLYACLPPAGRCTLYLPPATFARTNTIPLRTTAILYCITWRTCYLPLPTAPCRFPLPALAFLALCHLLYSGILPCLPPLPLFHRTCRPSPDGETYAHSCLPYFAVSPGAGRKTPPAKSERLQLTVPLRQAATRAAGRAEGRLFIYWCLLPRYLPGGRRHFYCLPPPTPGSVVTRSTPRCYRPPHTTAHHRAGVRGLCLPCLPTTAARTPFARPVTLPLPAYCCGIFGPKICEK